MAAVRPDTCYKYHVVPQPNLLKPEDSTSFLPSRLANDGAADAVPIASPRWAKKKTAMSRKKKSMRPPSAPTVPCGQ